MMSVRGRRPRFSQATWSVAILLNVAVAGPAFADTGLVTWPTYFRTGPGNHFVVLQELARGEAVDVQSCTDHWCQVQIGRVMGYVDQTNLGQQAPPSRFPIPGAQQVGCFDSRRAGYQNGEVFVYCPK